jgi:hypothetical protein
MGRFVVRPVLVPCQVQEIDEAHEPDGNQQPMDARDPKINYKQLP